jgi:hypothetical protein
MHSSGAGADVQRPVLPAQFRWIGVALAAFGAAGVAAFGRDSHERTGGLIVAAITAIVWSAAVLSGVIRIRMRGSVMPAWATATRYIVGGVTLLVVTFGIPPGSSNQPVQLANAVSALALGVALGVTATHVAKKLFYKK